MRLGRVILVFIIFISFPVVHASYVSYQEEWSIYSFNPETGETQLIYTNPYEITSILVNPDGDQLAYSVNLGGGYDYSEIFTINTDGSGLTQLTDNEYWNVYPHWSPDGTEIAFLSWRDTNLDVYIMDADGANQRLHYDSGGHDADLSWRGDSIAFTRDSQIWVMNSDGTDPRQLTDPPRAGEWGNAVLPFGDYDPRISPDGSTIVFERMVNDTSPHGNYDLFLIDFDGSNERRLTETGWTQGIASWSSDGGNLIYLVSAKGLDGAYDIYRINPDGSDMIDLTSEHFEKSFLVHSPVYSPDGSIYFVGQWYGWMKQNSILSCTVFPNPTFLGKTVSVTGIIQKPVCGIEYTIIVTEPDGTETLEIIESPDGSYTYNIDADVAGEWMVQVAWAGNQGYEASTTSVNFIVSETEEKLGGIPGFPLFSVILGLIAVSVIKKYD